MLSECRRMVIADAESPGPLRKRPRLSLKVLKSGPTAKETASSTGPDGDNKREPAEAKSVIRSQDDVRCDEAKIVQELCDDGPSTDYIQEVKQVPAVTSLVNLGNTCFLNSIMQVLRYTPGFLYRLEDLFQQIIQIEKLKKQVQAEKEDPGSSDNNDTVQTIELVKHMFRFYRNMERQEDKHSDVATADVTSMALKPDRILSAIREINPMFEGHLQHDAQELLRCILCYLQDAEKEIYKIRSSLPPRVLPQSSGPLNPIMQRFLCAGKGLSAKGVYKQEKCEGNGTPSGEVVGASEKSAKSVNVYHKPDILDQIEQCEAVKSQRADNITVTEADSKNKGGPKVKGEPSNVKSPQETRGRKTKACGSKGRPRSQDGSDSSDLNCDSEVKNTKSERSRSLWNDTGDHCQNDRSDEPDGTVSSSVRQQADPEKEEESIRSFRKPRGRKSVGRDKHNNENDSDSSAQNLKQLGILNMLQNQARCKRLGMRGALVKKDQHSALGSVANVTTSDETSQNTAESKENGSISISACKSNHVTNTNSPISSPRQPYIKLEKCDHVCDSPKKSVSADYATMKLSPFKTKTHTESPRNKSFSPRKSESVGKARHKLTFSCENQDYKMPSQGSTIVSPKKLNTSPAKCGKTNQRKNRHDIVEKLFMGTMMLRTKCLECESSRERIEEFHDISVPVRKKTLEESDDEEEEDETDQDGDSCLKKLMEAFTEVERLRDDNKYFCDNCIRYVEAERSLHYEVLPDILSLHLKRFSATSGIYGYVSKINDHVSIPLSLPCLRYKCPSPCSRPDHRYKLYAVVTHAGATLSSGHYLAYVRVAAESPAALSGGGRDLRSVSSPTLSRDSVSSSSTNFLSVPKQRYGSQWLECDDETVRIYTEEKFCAMLKGLDGSLLGTPYVLFYHRVIQGW